jgi:hypothetical protein
MIDVAYGTIVREVEWKEMTSEEKFMQRDTGQTADVAGLTKQQQETKFWVKKL